MNNQKFEEIISEVQEKAKKEVNKKYSSDMLGYIYALEKEMKKILKDEYGIERSTTTENYTGDNID